MAQPLEAFRSMYAVTQKVFCFTGASRSFAHGVDEHCPFGWIGMAVEPRIMTCFAKYRKTLSSICVALSQTLVDWMYCRSGDSEYHMRSPLLIQHFRSICDHGEHDRIGTEE